MNMNNKFDDILNECLDRIIKGETVETCLKMYPDQAQELEPLLRTALSARVASTIQPRSEFKAKARAEFQSAVREMQAKKARRATRFSWRWQWQPAWSIAVATFAIVVIAGGSSVYAAGNSMPDEALYSLKIATENVQLALTSSDIGKAELNAKFADRRVDEIIQMTSTGDSQDVLIASNNLNQNLTNMSNIPSIQTTWSNDGIPTDGSASRNADQSAPMLAFGASTAADNKSATQNIPEETPNPAYLPDNTTDITPVPAPLAPEITTSEPVHVKGGEQVHTAGTKNARAPELEKVREIIISNYLARQARLEQALEKASPEMRPIIQQAIDQSNLEYEKALLNIELAEYAP